jgi:hypothetical protein
LRAARQGNHRANEYWVGGSRVVAEEKEYSVSSSASAAAAALGIFWRRGRCVAERMRRRMRLVDVDAWLAIDQPATVDGTALEVEIAKSSATLSKRRRGTGGNVAALSTVRCKGARRVARGYGQLRWKRG